MMIQFGKQIVMIHKKLAYGRMKIGLQDAVCTIHGAEGADVKNLISAAGIAIACPGIL